MTPPIAIVGGGPAGLALAGMLERAGLDYVVYERSAQDTSPRGGCLDLHIGSGQRAMKEAGCYDEMRRYGRLGEATIHWVWDHLGNKVFSWGEGRDAPELDRTQIKKALLTTIPDDKILWRKGVTASKRDENGQIVLSFSDGTSATGFKLVVGADGTWSKIRHLVTPAVPKYSGILFLTGEIHASNQDYAFLEKLAGAGPMVVMGRSKKIWIQRQGDGRYRVDLGFRGPEDFATNGPVDVSDAEAVKRLMLTDDYFGAHAPDIKHVVEACEGPFRVWPLYYMPLEQLNWPAAADVTLIGDAAHTTTPFVGDGVNCAMRDSCLLSGELRKYGLSERAVSEYEKDMFPYAIDVIERSLLAGDLFFDWNSPATFMEAMAKRPLIGIRDEA